MPIVPIFIHLAGIVMPVSASSYPYLIPPTIFSEVFGTRLNTYTISVPLVLFGISVIKLLSFLKLRIGLYRQQYRHEGGEG
jgi:hypothetical protein